MEKLNYDVCILHMTVVLPILLKSNSVLATQFACTVAVKYMLQNVVSLCVTNKFFESLTPF